METGMFIGPSGSIAKGRVAGSWWAWFLCWGGSMNRIISIAEHIA